MPLALSPREVSGITDWFIERWHYLEKSGVVRVDEKTPRRILLVQNDDAERATSDARLKLLGHESATTWSGSEALNLLKLKKFDVLLVEDYLADMYIGDFLDRVSALNPAPRIWVMQDIPVDTESTFGTRSYPLVGKRHLEKLFGDLDGERSSAAKAPATNWKH